MDTKMRKIERKACFMKFRPCIDIHNGKVKQIVGGSLADRKNFVSENFVSEYGADFYARLYKENDLKGGHIIILNARGSEYYGADREQAFRALREYEGGLQIGGGVNAENASEYLSRGASHIIVTSYVFKDGKVNFDNLEKLKKSVGRERIVLDLSCRRRDGEYYVVTDRWQKFTGLVLSFETLELLSSYCDEFLVHAVDVEGKASGIEKELAKILADFGEATYAGGIGSFADLDKLREVGRGKLDFTVGSALDIFGGSMSFEKVIKYH